MNYLNTNLPLILFSKVLKQKIYVDKSLLIQPLNNLIGTNDCFVCITRPRRFGKTINVNMLGAYYTKGYDSGKLFDTLKISHDESYFQHLNQHNVIYIDFSRVPDVCYNYQDYILSVMRNLREDLYESYPQLRNKEYDSVSSMLRDTSDSFIFIMDEWDSIFHTDFADEEDKKHFLRFLKGLLKDQPYVDLAYMTGVLPIAKYSSGSELNMFWEYNFLNDPKYKDFFGLNNSEFTITDC